MPGHRRLPRATPSQRGVGARAHAELNVSFGERDLCEVTGRVVEQVVAP